MLKKVFVFISLSVLLIGFILLYCNLPSPPAGPEEAKVSLLFKSSDGKIDETGSITDSVGKEVQIGLVLHLTQYIDSSVVRVFMGADTERTFPWKFKNNMDDTIFFPPVTFTKTGTYLIEATGYIADQPNSVAKGKNIIYGPPSINKKPELKVPGSQIATVGQTISFSVSASDSNSDQTVTIRSSKKPENATFTADSFKWTPAISDTGMVWVVFVATDNGVPVMSDTDSVTIHVSATQTNHAPQWNPKNIQRTVKPGVLFSNDLSSTCSDLDNDSLTFSLIPAPPIKDTIIGTTYSFTPTVLDTGKHAIHILAKDPSGLIDTFTLGLTVSTTDVPDNDKRGPVISLVNPAKDSITTGTSSYTVIVKCTDPSGVASVNGASGATAYTGVRDTGSLWKINVSSLENNKVTVVVLTATDSSLKANKTLDTIYIRSEIVNGFKITFDKNDVTATGTMAEQTINSGDSAKLAMNAFVKDGSLFSGWMTASTGTSIAYTDGAMFKMGTSNVTLYAKWTKKTTFTLNITAANGAVTRSPDAAAYDSGTVVSLTPVPSNNYHFSGWSGALTGTANPTTITMNSNKAVTALFEANPPNTFSLTVTASNGTVKKTPDLPQYDSGSTVGLKATANTGYKFVNWSGDATGTSDSTAVVINSGKNVTANFVLIPYQLTVAAVNGTITLPTTSTTTVNHGVLTSIKAVANTGYSFTNWAVTTGTATITSPSADSTAVSLTSGDATVTATFTAIPVTLTLTNDGHGATTPASTASGSYGVPITISAAASSGYNFSGWTTTIGTAVFGNANQAGTTVTLTANATIRANFTAVPVTLTLTNDGHGTTTPASTASGSYGVPITISATASSGYSFSGWTTTTGTAVFDNANQASTTVTLMANATIKANFTPNLLRPINVAATSPVCSGNASTLTASIPTNGAGTLTWYRGSCGGGTAVGTGASVSSGTLINNATFYVRAEAGGNYSECASVNVTVNQPASSSVTGNATPSSVCLVSGQNVTLTVTSGSPGTNGTWVWYENDKITKVSTNPVTPQAIGVFNYYVRSENSLCGTGPWSSAVQVTVNQVAGTPIGNVEPNPICLASANGQQATLSVTSGNAGTGGQWVWYKSDKTTKVSSTFLPAAAGTFDYFVRSENGACGNGAWSGPISLQVVDPINIVSDFPTTATANVGEQIHLSAIMASVGGEYIYDITYYEGNALLTDYMLHGALLINPRPAGTYYFHAIIRDATSGCEKKSTVVAVTVQ